MALVAVSVMMLRFAARARCSIITMRARRCGDSWSGIKTMTRRYLKMRCGNVYAVPFECTTDDSMPNLTIQTFEEAVHEIRDLQSEYRNTQDQITQKARRLVLTRFRQGKIASQVTQMEHEAKYGQDLIGELAKQTGVHKRTLYRAAQFYQHPEFQESESRLRQWMTEKEEEKGRLSWRYCRNWTAKQLNGQDDNTEENSEQETEARLQETQQKVEESAKRTEQHAADLVEEVERVRQNGSVSEEVIEQAEGVALHAKQVAEDAKNQAEWMEVPQGERIRSESYLDHVRTYNCIVCGNSSPDASHVRSSATAKKDHDLFTWPLCRTHHNEYDNGKADFCKKYDIDPWRSVAFLLANYMTKKQLS